MKIDPSSGKSHLIIGGGVIGLCCAWFLARSGAKVVVIDRDTSSRRESCSDRNAGMIVPSHFIPLAAPGVISQGLRWMLNRRSPFYLRPRIDPALWTWCWHFVRHSNRRHVENTKELLRDLSLESRALMVGLSEELGFPLVERGLLMLCQTEQGLHEESEVVRMANAIGIEAEICGPERLTELDPGIEMKALGGVWFPQDCHLDSERFLEALRRGIREQGGIIRQGEVAGFEKKTDRIAAAISGDGERLEADQWIIAGGAWSPDLAKHLGLRLPLQAGKGYSFTLENPPALPRLCSLLKEGRVAVTPMGQNLRVAGTMEICGDDLSIDHIRLRGIIDSFCRFFPEFSPDHFEGLNPWSGLRPCSPDGLPYIGRCPKFANVTIATGHAMLGLSLGAVTGRLVADLHRGEIPDRRLAPSRFE